MLRLEGDSEGVQLAVRVQPGARRTGVIGLYGSELKIALQAPAVDGRANDALVGFLAELAGVGKSSVAIRKGQKSRSKTIRIDGVDEAGFRAKLEAMGAK